MDNFEEYEELERALKRLVREKQTWALEQVGAWAYCGQCNIIYNKWNPFCKREDKTCPTCMVVKLANDIYFKRRDDGQE